MNISTNGIKWLTLREGFRQKAYKDEAGKWTTGVGHLIMPHEQYLITKTLTTDEVHSILRTDLVRFVSAVNKSLTVSVNQHQFDALVFLAYNIGEAGIKGSTAVKNLNAGISPDAAWQSWNKITDPKTKVKKISPQLIKTRKAELQVFHTGIYNDPWTGKAMTLVTTGVTSLILIPLAILSYFLLNK